MFYGEIELCLLVSHQNKSMKVIVTGSAGMVWKAILLECLDDDRITEVFVLNRRSLEIEHAKLKEVIIEDFFHLPSVDFSTYDACFPPWAFLLLVWMKRSIIDLHLML